MNTERSQCQSGLVTYPNGQKGILAVGGLSEKSSEFLDLHGNTWTIKISLPFDISGGETVQWKESFLILGGYSIDKSKKI